MLDNYQQRDVKSYKASPLPDPIPVVAGEVNDIGYDNPPDHQSLNSRPTDSSMSSPDLLPVNFPFKPVISDDSPYTFTLAPSYVHEFSNNLTHSVTKVDQVVVIGDVWWLNIITQPNGDITATTLALNPLAKLTTEFEEVTTTNVAIDGDYWIKAFEFFADPDGGNVPAVSSYLHESLTWDYRANINVGAGAEVFKGFSLASFNEFRSLDSAIADIGAVDSLPSGDTLTLPVYVTAAVNGDEIELSGKVVVPDGGGGGGVSGLPYTIYFADDTTATITEAQIAVGQVNNWGIVCTVSSGAMTGAAVGAGTDRFVGDPQTAYFLPVYIGGVRVSSGGLYQEDSMCDDGTPVVGLIKVG